MAYMPDTCYLPSEPSLASSIYQPWYPCSISAGCAHYPQPLTDVHPALQHLAQIPRGWETTDA